MIQWQKTMLEKRERVTMGGKGRGEIRGDAGEVSGVIANVPPMDGLRKKGMEYLVDGGWQLEKWRYCWWFLGLMWTEMRKPDLSTNMSISRKVIWEREMVQVNWTG